MATRAPFLTQPYGAYYHRDVPTEDEELTHVGPGTPCGEYLRRFWQPVALSKDVQALPRRVRLLSEDLVVFRDQSGRVGCLELHCPHRGTSLEFGLIAEQVEKREIGKLYEYRRSAPHGRLSVPTTEHFDPLFVVMGASWPDDRVETIFAGFHHGNLSMRSFSLNDL